MRIGGASRDNLMILIPVAAALGVAVVLLGGPDDALRAIERTAWDGWDMVANWFRR
jgi:hypothetical protein